MAEGWRFESAPYPRTALGNLDGFGPDLTTEYVPPGALVDGYFLVRVPASAFGES